MFVVHIAGTHFIVAGQSELTQLEMVVTVHGMSVECVVCVWRRRKIKEYTHNKINCIVLF